MTIKSSKISWVVFAGWMIFSQTSAFAAPVGEATRVQRFAYQTQEQSSKRPIFRFEQIHQNALLETVQSGAMQVTFKDGSVLTLGSASKVVVDKFVYQSNDAPSQSIRLSKGLFRFVSGAMPKDSVRLNTPTVSIGIRGTTLKIQVLEDSSAKIFFEHGEGFVSANSGPAVNVRQGEQISVSAKGEIGVPVQAPWSAGDHAVDQGLQAFGVIFGGPGAGSGSSSVSGTTGPQDAATSP